MRRVFLLFGSNLGNREENLGTAAAHVQKVAGAITSVSSIYATAAWGKTDQPDFFNQVIEIATSLAPEALLDTLLKIEQRMGRERKEKWGERLIDIDILFIDDLIHHSATLHVPHPQIAERRFTLVPLAEIAPSFVHPLLNKTITELLNECPDTLQVRKL